MIDKNQILRLESDLAEAMKNGDVNQLNNLLHEDLLFTIPNGQTITKEMDLNNFKNNLIKIDEILIEEIKTSIISDNVIVSSRIKMNGSFNKEPFGGKFKYLRVWKSFNGEWKVIGGAGLNLAE